MDGLHVGIEKVLRIAERQHGVVTRSQVLRTGLSRYELDGEVRRRRLERVGRNVLRVHGSVPSWRQALLAAVLAAGPTAVASHRSAAALWGIPGYREGPVEVLRLGRRSRASARPKLRETGLLLSHHVRTVDGIPVTSPARTLFDLCGLCDERTLDRARRAVANAVTMRLTTLPALTVVLAETAACGRPGSAILRLVLQDLDDGQPVTESELEAVLLPITRRAALPDPRRQVSVGGTTAPVGRVDFVWDPCVVVEADGKAGHSSWLDIENDRRRDAKLTAAGFHVLRTTWAQLRDEPELFTAALRGAIARGS